MKYTITQSRLLYVMHIDDRKHHGLLKIGEVFVDNDVADNSSKQALAKAVRDILDKRSYMKGVTYAIDYVECTTYEQQTKCYKADDVYRTLIKMGVAYKALDKYKGEEADIWFAAEPFDPLARIKEAIQKIKNGSGAGYGEIKFRPEQDDAIQDTVEHFKTAKGKSFLWNAKMRFGKTLSGLEVAKEMDYKSTLIITHRPVVDKGWHDDFRKIFGKQPEYVYATRMSDDDATGGDFYQIIKDVDAGRKRLIFFVSMQYLRLSQVVSGKERYFDPLKAAIMEYDWDFVMVDEAHEGIEAAAGKRVMNKLEKEKTRILSLSGTPFNLLDKYKEGEIYTWDYVMEQKAKQEWDDKHFGDPNPYAELPRMQILTFTLPKMVREEAVENNEMFRFHEFFRVWTEADKASIRNLMTLEQNPVRKQELQEKLNGIVIDRFVHEDAVRAFVKKLRTTSDTSQYPFSTDEFRDKFRHTFWLLPGVKEAAALEAILREDKVFGKPSMFHIINAAGDGNIEDKDGSALAEVEDNIRGYDPAKDPDRKRAAKKKAVLAKKRTITLSCGKLTTGVSVPEWTAVLCMKGSENTPAANYMQTIFRVQTHAVLNGRQKSDAYVFDFAPDRALTAVAETAKMAVYAQDRDGKKQLKLTQKKEEEHLADFIKLCPVLSMDEGEMGKHFTANQIFEKLSNVYIERAVRSGYADNSLYNPDQLMNLTPEQEKALGDVHDLLGSMPASWKPEKITITDNGLGEGKYEQVKFIYYLSGENKEPERPKMSEKQDNDGRPTSETEGWDDVMCAPSQLFPYLFISNSRLIQGEWTEFSKPLLYHRWTDRDSSKTEDQKKRDEENKEKRARMSVLRGVSIRIPLLVYGAEINDDAGEEITIDNFASDDIVDDASWEEFMPKGFTKETFNILKDCFDRSIFTGAAKRIRQMVKEADNLNTEDRINKIATIFSYFHNPDKETVLTPWRVVNMHMSDCLGGWCFQNEQFDGNYIDENEYGENINAARFVDRGQVTKDVFGDYNARILEINSKTGLYPLYMAYSIFKTVKEPEWRRVELTGERGKSRNAEQYDHQAGNDLEIWKDVLQDNIFVVCRTKMAVSITKRTLAGFRKDIRMNVKCYEHEVSVNDLITAGIIKATDEGVTKVGKTYYYNGQEALECDMINVLRAKPELFQADVVRGNDYWGVYNSIPKANNEDINNMKFNAIVGNPPYQIMDGGAGASAKPVYNYFVQVSKDINPGYLSFIMPARWYAGGKGLDEFREDMLNDVKISKLFDFPDARDCFPNTVISGGVCYFLRDNKSVVDSCEFTNTMNGARSTKKRKLNDFPTLIRFNDAVSIAEKTKNLTKETLSTIVSSRNPFGFSSNVRGQEFGIYTLYHSRGTGSLSPNDITSNKELADKYKVMLGKVISGHAGETNSEGTIKVFATMQVIRPHDVCTDSYIILGSYDNEKEAHNLYCYLKTKFVRFLVNLTLSSINIVRGNFAYVPIQDFSSASDIDWKRPIADIDKQLYKKYGLSCKEQDFIESMMSVIE